MYKSAIFCLPLLVFASGVVAGQICHGAAELLHTHFCCTQWHASAFDDRLEDDAFLHAADLAEPPAAVAVGDGTGSFSLSHHHQRSALPLAAVAEEKEEEQAEGAGGLEGHGEGARAGAGAARANANDPRLRMLHERLVGQRAVLWQEIETKMVGLVTRDLGVWLL